MRKRCLHIEGQTPADFANRYNDAIEMLDGCEIIREERNPDGSMFLFYESPYDDEIEQIRRRAEAAYQQRQPDYIVDAAEQERDIKSILIELRIDMPVGRICAECDNYDWGHGCPYRDGHVQIKDQACPMFNVNLRRG